MNMKRAKKPMIIILSAVVVVGIVGGIALAATGVFSDKSNKRKFRNEQEGFKRFSYTLKEKYNSYDEVVNELENLAEVYKTNIDGCSDEYVESVQEVFIKKKEQLENLGAKFPESKQKRSKEQEFYYSVEFLADMDVQAKHKGIANELYTKAQTIKEDYEKGKIDINQATERLSELEYKNRYSVR